MKIQKKVKEISEINIGFDIHLAEIKLNKINSLLNEIENSLFKDVLETPREDIIEFLQICYGVSYEIGNTKQHLRSNIEIKIEKRILPIARLIFGKTKELLPYLSLNLHNSIGDVELHRVLEMEISEINNQ
ncbi:MAG: hypothetical protein ACK5IQ_06075 [Bacteroidales bacterium]